MRNLLELPTDILLVIFSYIPSVHLIRSVSVVCVEFRDILNSESFWKRRYNQKSGLTLNSLHNWKLGCCQNDDLQRIVEDRATIGIFKGMQIVRPSKKCPARTCPVIKLQVMDTTYRMYCYTGHSPYHAW